ncbi:hypothetical protein, partial [Bacteroides xylanisolvens]|uniref:hypothetical protein n=1 Tax=Bacteroides xylanisolvens TaxID=371601 RepID=UPI001C037239
KIKRKAHVKQSFSLDFLERGTFTEYPLINQRQNRHIEPTLCSIQPYIYVQYWLSSFSYGIPLTQILTHILD